MKKEPLQYIDEYFRQHEADVPVVFDATHWQQLATALDTAAPRPQSPVPPTPHKWHPNWWISGTLAGLLAITVYLLIQRPEPPTPAQQAYPGSPAPANILSPVKDSLSEKTSPDSHQASHQSQNTRGGLHRPTVPPDTKTLTPPKERPTPVKDTLNIRPAILPADSSAVVPVNTAKKKKKHLFW